MQQEVKIVGNYSRIWEKTGDMQKYKEKLYMIGKLIPMILALCLLLTVSINSGQSDQAKPAACVLQGEYSQNGGAWIPWEKEVRLSALDGDVTFRGNFTSEIKEGVNIQLYTNHITASIWVNGQEIACDALMDDGTDVSSCGTGWKSVISPGITTEDIVEIRLHNPHSFGNREAYTKLLTSIYTVQQHELRGMLEAQNFFFSRIGIVILIISVMILGFSFIFSATQDTYEGKMTVFSLLSLFSGIYIIFDTADVSLWSRVTAFNTQILFLSMMLAAFSFCMYISREVSGKAKTVVTAVAVAEGSVLTMIKAACLCKVTMLYDMMPFWMILQIVICAVLLVCCICEGAFRSRRISLYLCIGLIISMGADSLNYFFYWWEQGLISKAAFLIFFFYSFVKGTQRMLEELRVSAEAKRLEGELKNSNIVLAVSQIRAHFIFNILNAISGMCKYDPERADETVVCFSRYLRTNIDIMQEDKPVNFHVALKHLEDYVTLEQIRFEDKVKFVKDITVNDFMIPLLVLQPIVENAIKHGVTPKSSGGTVILRTWKDEEYIYISIQDDGVGFDPDSLKDKTGVGLKNVRFRLEHMIDGKMTVESKIGEGTTVTIYIPYKEV